MIHQKKRKNGAKIWNNSQRIINYNRTFRVESKQKSNNVSRAFFLSEIKIIHISILIPKDLLYLDDTGRTMNFLVFLCTTIVSFEKEKKEGVNLHLLAAFVATFGRGGWRVVRQRDKTERGKERKVRDTKRNGEEGERERKRKKEEKRKETRGGEKKQWLQCNVDGPSLIYSVTIDEEVVEEESKFVIVRLHGVAAVTNSPPPRTVAFSLRRCSSHVNRLFLFLSRVHAECASTEIRKFR